MQTVHLVQSVQSFPDTRVSHALARAVQHVHAVHPGVANVVSLRATSAPALGAEARHEWAMFLQREGADELARETLLDGVSEEERDGEIARFQRVWAELAETR